MTLYAIGDVQGCRGALESLLRAIDFAPERDRLWLVGDLVNRGPDSLGVLRSVMALGESAVTVLGNHDLHLLAAAAGIRAAQPQDTIGPVLSAPDRDALLDWLRRRPLLHRDPAGNRLLVHAGVPPTWSVAEAERAAREVEDLLRGDDWARGLGSMYGDAPSRWRDGLSRPERVRYTINALTRMRYCRADGGLDFDATGPPGSQPAGLVPWFDHPRRRREGVHVVFGHWAALGVVRRDDLTATDSGCVWGGTLTAVPLEPAGEPVSVACSERDAPGRGPARPRPAP